MMSSTTRHLHRHHHRLMYGECSNCNGSTWGRQLTNSPVYKNTNIQVYKNHQVYNQQRFVLLL